MDAKGERRRGALSQVLQGLRRLAESKGLVLGWEDGIGWTWSEVRTTTPPSPSMATPSIKRTPSARQGASTPTPERQPGEPYTVFRARVAQHVR